MIVLNPLIFQLLVDIKIEMIKNLCGSGATKTLTNKNWKLYLYIEQDDSDLTVT